MFTINGRTQSQQASAHADACLAYAREALAAGDTAEAQRHVNAAEAWNNRARVL